jgi:hypothetical protein
MAWLASTSTLPVLQGEVECMNFNLRYLDHSVQADNYRSILRYLGFNLSSRLLVRH